MNGNWPETKVDFKKTQQEFAAYIRDPDTNVAPEDVKRERMQMYRELFFNNVEGFVSSNFPVLRSIMPDSKWYQLVQGFFSGHACKTPHFSEIPEEFLSYLQSESCDDAEFPFILELAHYEWVEMALAIAKEELPEEVNLEESVFSSSIKLSPLAWCLAYQFPVHQISPESVPSGTPGTPTFLVVYRNINDEVRFLEVTPIIYRMLLIIEEHPGIKLKLLLNQLKDEFAVVDAEEFWRFGQDAIKELNKKAIILPG